MRRTLAACATLLVAFATIAIPGARAQETTDFSTALAPLNRSGGSGSVTIDVDGDQVTVRLEANGVSPNLPHAQHIHIGGRNVCPPPGAGATHPPTDLIDTVEGQPFYGGIEVSLTTEGDLGAASGLAVERFPTAEADGSYVYERTFALPEGVTVDDLGDGVIVVHGISTLFDDATKYDGEPRSSLAPDMFPLEATIPALCGELVEGDLADVADARDIDDACPPDMVADPRFTDVAEGNVHQEAIACIAFYDITTGITPSTYGPDRPVPRDQMASFIARLIETVDPGALEQGSDDVNAFPCASNPADLTMANVHYEAIQLLADAGVVLGGPAGLPSDCFGPELAVTRAQMATYIHQAEQFLGQGIDTPLNFFVDDEDSVHEENINAIASEAIAVGVGNSRFEPGANVARDQMASFLARKLDYLVEQNDVEVPVEASRS